MKKITFFLLFTLPMLSVAQINVVHVPKSEIIGKNTGWNVDYIILEKLGDKYTFTYKDLKYQHINEYKDFSFRDIDNAFENLYNIIINGLIELPEDPVYIEIPEGFLKLDFDKSLGVSFVTMSHSQGSSGEIIGKMMWLDKKRVDKLFGKGKKK